MTRRSEERLLVAVFLAPALVLYTVFVAGPGVRALVYSLQEWNGLSDPKWAGAANFVRMLKDSDLFLRALWHNVLITVAGGGMTLVLALVFAGLLHRRFRGSTVFRVAFFFPNVIASVAVALLWVLLYSTTSFGLINRLLAALQGWAPALVPVDLPFPFLGSQYLIWSIIPMTVWTATGFYLVLFLAAMEGIPESLYEAATLDGASGAAQFRHITLPLIREVLTVGVVFLVIGNLKLFDVIWVMENQYPSPETHVLATLMYQKVFSEYNIGYGSAVAVLLFVLVFAATLVVLRVGRRDALEY